MPERYPSVERVKMESDDWEVAHIVAPERRAIGVEVKEVTERGVEGMTRRWGDSEISILVDVQGGSEAGEEGRDRRGSEGDRVRKRSGGREL
mmetsp:Transcript_6703/g.13426  ORF Transcript_6703/g.13426 Transcript_6703/m.13426 type:complete len:92 (+) Transcript_6703:1910-2185(+)